MRESVGSLRRRTASEVVRERYGEEAAAQQADELFALTGRQAKVAIELVGMAGGRARPLVELRSVSVAGCAVAELDGELARLCPALQELDASGNELACVGAALAALGGAVASLNLALNPLAQLSPSPVFCSAPLHTLSVAGSRVPLEELLACLPPSLCVLDLSDCPHLSFLPAALAERCPGLSQLHANGCGLARWSDVDACVAKLPALEKLFLSRNPLSSVGPLRPGALERLELLAVAGTRLEDFAWAEAIAHLQHLRHIRFADTPCHRLPRSRLLLLMRLPNLAQLNGAEVPERERLDAEILRVKQSGNVAPKDSQPVGAAPARPPLTAQFSSPSGTQSPAIVVSPETTVSMLRDLAFRHTRVPPFRQRLWARAAGDVQRTALDQPEASLDWCGKGFCLFRFDMLQKVRILVGCGGRVGGRGGVTKRRE